MRKLFHEQLDSVTDELVQMTRLVGSAINRATQALLDADLQLAESVIEGDEAVDALAARSMTSVSRSRLDKPPSPPTCESS